MNTQTTIRFRHEQFLQCKLTTTFFQIISKLFIEFLPISWNKSQLEKKKLLQAFKKNLQIDY